MPADHTPHSVAAPRRPTLTLKKPAPTSRPMSGPVLATPRPSLPSVPSGKVWINWRDNGFRPRKRHSSLNAALTEATRLARLNPGVAIRTYELTFVHVTCEPAAE